MQYLIVQIRVVMVWSIACYWSCSIFCHNRFYPYHYAPFVSDIKGIGDMSIKFDLSVPFLPFEQLLAVLPANSKSLLPEAYQVSIASDKPQYFDCVEINLKRMNMYMYLYVHYVSQEKREANLCTNLFRLT